MQVKDFHGKSVIDSREVAEMVGKNHAHLLRDIAGYIKIMEKTNESTFGLVGNGLNFQLEMDKFRLLCGIAVAMIVAVFFVTLIVAVIWR